MTEPRLQALRRQIETAFADAVYPGDEYIGYNPDDWESAELAQDFKGKHWKEVPLEKLQYHSSSFLSPAGFRYYLPAYLLAALADYGNLLPHTVYALTLPEKSSLEEQGLWQWHLARFDGLTPAQKEAVRAFLEYARDEASHYFFQGELPRLALERYWTRGAASPPG